MKARKPSISRAEAVAEVRQIYANLAARPIERACTQLTECCQFHLTGRTPHLTAGEALLAAKALRATGRKALPAPVIRGACPLLRAENGRCLIYADRPFGCRTHFCRAAGGPYARREVADLIHRLEAVDQALGGQGDLPISEAITQALQTGVIT